MRFYLEMIKVAIKSTLQYRKAFIITIIVHIVTLSIYYMLFTSVYAYNKSQYIVGYSLQQMIWYFGALTMTWSLVWNSMDWEVSGKILDGSLAVDLLRPKSLFVLGLGRSIGNVCLSVFFEFILVVIIQSFFVFPNFISLSSMVKYFIVIIFAFILYYLLNFIIGLSAFLTTNIKTMVNFKFALIAIFGGSYIPIEFFPTWLKKIIDFLPFQYIIYWPLQFFLNRQQTAGVNMLLRVVMMQIFWAIVLYIIYRALWFKAVRKYTAFGG